MQLSFEKYKEQYLKLPPDVQDAISSVAIGEAIYETGKDYGLRVDQLAVLGEQVTLVLLGITHPNNFVSRLKSALPQPITDVQIQNVVKDIDELVFEPVRQSILGMHSNSNRETPQQAPAVIYPQKPVAQPTVPQQTSAVPPINLPTAPQGTTQTPPKDVVQTKLEQSFRMPSTNTTVKESAPVAPKIVDPYREVVE